MADVNLTIQEQLAATFRALQEGIRSIPVVLDRWTLKHHEPFDMTGDGSGPMVCPRCKVDHPCDEYVRIKDRISAATNDRVERTGDPEHRG